ncbi:SGNH/GDSL hydrolase family protein [Lutibacter citreus]|uniref:SGNH/GDSL hydrolase family protein n=1 Tax=Lutibacter citreus TaxID=2138210 RepID=UPI000DBE22CC|nr:SGNH/GDSL hydrolase family protein [Lutibacter citreus]
MKPTTVNSFRNILALIFLCFGLSNINSIAQNLKSDSDFETTEELRMRSGLSNFFAKVNSSKKVVVGYVGGSITNQEGWRPKSFNWLEKHYSKASFEMINAAVPGTGAEFGNCRLEEALLVHQPDLVFIEYRVNGSGGFGVRAYEGLVRQIWLANPKTDICFVYTIGENMISNIRKGLQHGEGKKLERVAIHYNIPSIDFGIEVVKQLDVGNFIYRSKKPVNGKVIFAKDAVHPKDAGHQLYSQIVSRSFLKMENIGETGNHNLPVSIEKNHFVNSKLVPISKAILSKGWKEVSKNDETYKNDIFRTSQMLGDALKCSSEGETLRIEWEGKIIGFSTIPLGEGTEVEVSIDGGISKVFKFKQKASKFKNKPARKFANFFYAPELNEGKHKATLKVTKLAKGNNFYVGQFLVFGTPKN